MSSKNKNSHWKFFLGNLLPTINIAGLVTVLVLADGPFAKIVGALAWIYLLPPVIVRILHICFGRPQGKYAVSDRGFWVWFVGSQMQVLFLRFSFLEEALRIFPVLYSNWLRLWGATIGKNVYWSPRVYLLDRPFLEVQDLVLVGFGAGFTSHLLTRSPEGIELLVSTPVIEKAALVGGATRIGPGARVATQETLPATMALAPFYEWRDGRRRPLDKTRGIDL